jgi:hypothetical protein
MSSRIGMSAGTGSAGLQARVDGQEEKRLQPPRSTTSAAEARNCAGGLDAGLKGPHYPSCNHSGITLSTPASQLSDAAR